MKELSIEEKAKRYEEAIREASIAYKDEDRHLKATLERIFPELKESEGEKIRKQIISFLEGFERDHYRCLDFSYWIAWLEKQGEQKYNNTDFSDLRTWKYIVDAVLTEKEGIGQYLDSPVTEEVAKKLQKRFGNIEQMPVDKVEPKFKVGDWIVACYGSVNQVISVDEDVPRYTLDDGTYFSGSFSDKYHLWTIQDAKSGDVLASKDGYYILIFRNLDTKSTFSSYYNIKRIGELGWSVDYFIPATKEQRELLFQRMKEDGYQWSKNKKRLIRL